MEKVKPKVRLTGEDSNVFHLLGLCVRALRGAGMREEAEQLKKDVWKAKDYDDALVIMMRVVDAE